MIFSPETGALLSIALLLAGPTILPALEIFSYLRSKIRGR